MTYLEGLLKEAKDEGELDLFLHMLLTGKIEIIHESPEDKKVTDAFIEKLRMEYPDVECLKGNPEYPKVSRLH